jgi:mono/diheme cytochrome c family protein
VSSAKARSKHFYYLPILLIIAVAIGVIFFRYFKQGEFAGQNTPSASEGTQHGKTQTPNEQALAKDMTLAAKGKPLFATNCATCHGSKGFGDGERGASLNPKPRNFHLEKFKYGNDIVTIHNTILKGSPGTSMPSFALLPLEDTWALAHFVYTLIPDPPAITDQMVASLPSGSTATTGSSPNSAAHADTGSLKSEQRIPIQVAMQQLAAPEAASYGATRVNSSLPGAAIYAQRCAACHGPRGEGMPVRILSVAPYRYESSGSIAASTAPWTHNRTSFSDIVVKGMPGQSMPGEATLTSQQIDELYTFIHSLQSP